MSVTLIYNNYTVIESISGARRQNDVGIGRAPPEVNPLRHQGACTHNESKVISSPQMYGKHVTDAETDSSKKKTLAKPPSLAAAGGCYCNCNQPQMPEQTDPKHDNVRIPRGTQTLRLMIAVGAMKAESGNFNNSGTTFSDSPHSSTLCKAQSKSI